MFMHSDHSFRQIQSHDGEINKAVNLHSSHVEASESLLLLESELLKAMQLTVREMEQIKSLHLIACRDRLSVQGLRIL